jgi:transcriptional regulator with XRE-family HTH domain
VVSVKEWWRAVGWKEDPRLIFGKTIKGLREHQGISQEELAARMTKLGIGNWYQSTVYKVESASRPTSTDEVVALAHCLGVHPTFLWFEDATEAEARIVRSAIERNEESVSKYQRLTAEGQKLLKKQRAQLKALEGGR